MFHCLVDVSWHERFKVTFPRISLLIWPNSVDFCLIGITWFQSSIVQLYSRMKSFQDIFLQVCITECYYSGFASDCMLGRGEMDMGFASMKKLLRSANSSAKLNQFTQKSSTILNFKNDPPASSMLKNLKLLYFKQLKRNWETKRNLLLPLTNRFFV